MHPVSHASAGSTLPRASAWPDTHRYAMPVCSHQRDRACTTIPRRSSPGTATSRSPTRSSARASPTSLYLQGFISNLELNWDHPIVARFLALAGRLVAAHPPRPAGHRTCRSAHRPVTCAARDDHGDLRRGARRRRLIEQRAILATNELGMRRHPVRGDLSRAHSRRHPLRGVRELALDRGDALGVDGRAVREEEDGSVAPATGRLRTRHISDIESFAAVDGRRRSLHRVVVSLHPALRLAPGYALRPPRSTCAPTSAPSFPPFACPSPSSFDPTTPSPAGVSPATYVADHIPGAKRLRAARDGATLARQPGRAPRRGRPVHRGHAARSAELDRVLATVLFTDLVGSTETRGVASGDRQWRELVDRHHTTVAGPARSVPWHRGRHGRRRILRHVRRPGTGHSVRAGHRRVAGVAGHRGPSGTAHRASARRSMGRSAASP